MEAGAHGGNSINKTNFEVDEDLSLKPESKCILLSIAHPSPQCSQTVRVLVGAKRKCCEPNCESGDSGRFSLAKLGLPAVLGSL